MTSEADASKRDETAYCDRGKLDALVNSNKPKETTTIHFVGGGTVVADGNVIERFQMMAGNVGFLAFTGRVAVNLNNVTYMEVSNGDD